MEWALTQSVLSAEAKQGEEGETAEEEEEEEEAHDIHSSEHLRSIAQDHGFQHKNLDTVTAPHLQSIITSLPRSTPRSLSCSSRKNHHHHFHGFSSNSTSTIPRAVAPGTTAGAKATKNNNNSYSYDLQTLTVWLLKQEQAGIIHAELTVVLSSISMACKHIACLLQRANLSELTGAHGTFNVQGEDQKKLDVISNEVFCNCLRSSGRTGIIASEEEDVPVAVEESYSGDYIVVFDPLDGSANIDASCRKEEGKRERALQATVPLISNDKIKSNI